MKKRIIAIFIVISNGLLGCSEFEKQNYKRVVLVYMVADNNLDYFAIEDINEMEAGMMSTPDEDLIIYIDRGMNGIPAHPYLLKIIPDTTQQIVSEIIMTYPEQISTTKSVLDKVLDDAFSLYEHTSKGLVLWSHGNAWLPEDVSILSNRDKILDDTTKSYALDETEGEYRMDIIELAASLNGYKFDFLVFDACFMGAVEVLYELKNTAEYIISSPTEILSSGFPYKEVVPMMFDDFFEPTRIAQTYFQSYQEKTGLLQSASISVVKMSEFGLLTEKIKDALITKRKKTDLNAIKKETLELDRLQGEWVYDLLHFLSLTIETESFKNIKEQWNKTIIYQDKTEYMVNDIELKNCNGISTYIPDTIHSAEVNRYYKGLSWFKASGYDEIFTSI